MFIMSLQNMPSMRAQSMQYHYSNKYAANQHQPAAHIAERVIEEPIATKAAQTTVTCVYQTNIASFWRNVTVMWCKNLMNHSLSISVYCPETETSSTCKIDLKPWHFWSKKGFKSFDVDGCQVEVFWDLRSAKFSGGPEPCTDYYVALVSDEEVLLLLGDYKKKAYKRTRSRPALVDPVLFYKKEHVFGKKCFSTRAKFEERQRDHDIVVESSTLGPRDSEMWISIDGIVLIHVRNLQWKFRGNQTLFVNKQPVQVFWDVHNWLFAPPGSGPGLFIFKPGNGNSLETGSESFSRDASSRGGDSDYYSTQSYATAPDFCLFLYAWKIE